MKSNADLKTEANSNFSDNTSQLITPADLRNFCNDLIDSSVAAINALTVQGTDNTTTAVANFGINVITTATDSDFCTRLPLAVDGGISSFANKSGHIIRVFPSVSGGSINGIVDGIFDIPSDNKFYSFNCYENPDPGEWTISAPATNQIVIGEISIDHTQGTPDNYVGITSLPVSGDYDVGINSGNITLTPSSPNWLSQNSPSTATTLKVYTNILPNDAQSDGPTNPIAVYRVQAYLDSISTADVFQAEAVFFYNQINQTGGNDDGTRGVAPTGALNSPPLIGDTGTFYGTYPALILPPNDHSGTNSNQIGTGGQFSRYYNAFQIIIPSGAITKTYSFQINLEYF